MSYSTKICKLVEIIQALPQSNSRITNKFTTKPSIVLMLSRLCNMIKDKNSSTAYLVMYKLIT